MVKRLKSMDLSYVDSEPLSKSLVFRNNKIDPHFLFSITKSYGLGMISITEMESNNVEEALKLALVHGKIFHIKQRSLDVQPNFQSLSSKLGNSANSSSSNPNLWRTLTLFF